MSILAGVGSPEAIGLWGLQPTATPGVVWAFVTLDSSNGAFGNWTALLHMQFDQALATGVVPASSAAAAAASALAGPDHLRLRRRAAVAG